MPTPRKVQRHPPRWKPISAEDILKRRALGETLEEIAQSRGYHKERMRQILKSEKMNANQPEVKELSQWNRSRQGKKDTARNLLASIKAMHKRAATPGKVRRPPKGSEIRQRMVLGESIAQIAESRGYTRQRMLQILEEQKIKLSPELRELRVRNQKLRRVNAKDVPVTDEAVKNSVTELFERSGLKILSQKEHEQARSAAELKLLFRAGIPLNEGHMQKNPELRRIRGRAIIAQGSYSKAVEYALGIPYDQVRKQKRGQGLGGKLKTFKQRNAAIRKAWEAGNVTTRDLAKRFGLSESNVRWVVKGIKKGK